MKIEQRPLVWEIWNFSCQCDRPRPPFPATKSWKSGKCSEMHEKRPISPNRLFKYCLFPLKLFINRCRMTRENFRDNFQVCNGFCSRVIDEKPVEKSSMKFRRPMASEKAKLSFLKLFSKKYCIRRGITREIEYDSLQLCIWFNSIVIYKKKIFRCQ